MNIVVTVRALLFLETGVLVGFLAGNVGNSKPQTQVQLSSEVSALLLNNIRINIVIYAYNQIS
jgi:hypothetical protein